MKTENLSTLKIHKLSKEQYDRELAAGRIDETALYLTPDDAGDLDQFVTVDQLEEVANNKINVADIVDNLTTNAPDKPLSAAQGYKLKGLVDTAQNTADGKEAAGTAATMLNRTTPVNVDDTNYTAYMARGMSLVAEETSPTVYGTIAWHYK